MPYVYIKIHYKNRLRVFRYLQSNQVNLRPSHRVRLPQTCPSNLQLQYPLQMHPHTFPVNLRPSHRVRLPHTFQLLLSPLHLVETRHILLGMSTCCTIIRRLHALVWQRLQRVHTTVGASELIPPIALFNTWISVS